MKSVLSTKKLTSEQKAPFLEKGVDFSEHDFITVESVDFDFSTGSKKIENAIFTSQNAVKAIQNSTFTIQNAFCVGKKTKKMLEESGINVLAFANYGKELAEILVKKHSNEHFTFFCGNRRRDEIPTILKANKVSFEEIQVYKTTLNPKKIKQEIDGILFFSPSGVESFCAKNKLKNSTAFCIGTTTAAEAEKHTDKIVIAKEPTIESLVGQTVATQYFASSKIEQRKKYD